jgi:hypothetical protein
MVSPISSLSNMEMQLYGGMNYNSAAPSYANNYCGTSNYNTATSYGLPANYNTTGTNFGQVIPQQYMNQSAQMPQSAEQIQTQPETIFQGLTQTEQNALVNTYKKGLEPPEQLALCSGVIMQGLMMNPRVVAHPINTFKTFFNGASDTNKMFEAVKNGNSTLSKMWDKNAYIMEEAFAQMNRTECRSMSKLGWFRKQYSADEYKQLKDIMDKALKSGNIDEVAKATETLRHAQSSNGYIPGFIDKLRGKTSSTVASRLADTKVIQANTTKLLEEAKDMTFKQAWNRVGGKWGLAFGAIDLIGSAGKINAAFQEDTATGMKQLGQSIVKAGARTVGWQAGEALGVLAANKLTPTIAKNFGGKWGTLFGALARPVCALATSWLSSKVARWIVGDDVANKVQAKKATETPEGQQMMLQNILGRIQAGEQVDAPTQQALQKLMTMYA